jgi:hypothetical protein
LLKVLVVSGKPLVIACTKTGDELTTRTKAASSELNLFFFGIIAIPFYIFSLRFWLLGRWDRPGEKPTPEGFVGRWVLVRGPAFMSSCSAPVEL